MVIDDQRHVLAVTKDISERKEMEEELRRVVPVVRALADRLPAAQQNTTAAAAHAVHRFVVIPTIPVTFDLTSQRY